MTSAKIRISIVLLFFAFCFAVMVTACPEALMAEETVLLSADRQFEYASSCFDQKDYAAARAEFKRFIFFFPNDTRVDQADMYIGLSDFYSGEYQPALDRFRALHEEHGFNDLGMSGALNVVKTLAAMGHYTEGADYLHERLLKVESPVKVGTLQYHLAWLYVESGRFAKAGMHFDAIDSDDPLFRQIPEIKAGLEDYTRIPSKSPTAAALLSVIPGGGYVYCERYQDAFISLVLNSLMAWAAAESFTNDLYGLGGLVSLVGAGFYAGNIYGAATAAHKYNRQQQAAFARDLKNRFSVHLFNGPQSDSGASWSVQYRF